MRIRALFFMLVVVATTITVLADGPRSVAAHAVTLDPPRGSEKVAVYRGHAHPNAKVRLMRRTASGWSRVTTARADDRGAYRMRTQRPTSAWKVRTVARGQRSRVRTVAPVPEATEEPTAPEEPTTPGVPTTPEVPEPLPPDACGQRLAKADGTLWECTFHDEFDGAELDTSKWLVQETWYSGMTSGNRDCYVKNADTIAVVDGVLRLTAHRELEEFTCSNPYGDFATTSTAAAVATRDRFTQTYGRFAFRAKFPDTAGIPGPHGALWLYPQKHTYGAWPHSGEIDVAEWFSARPDNVYPSAHYLGEDPKLSSGYDCPMPTAGTEYHTYAVEWSATEMRFLYDGELCFEHSWTPEGLTAPQPFDHPFYVVLTEAWGSAWNAVTTATPTSATLSVDWVRAWR